MNTRFDVEYDCYRIKISEPRPIIQPVSLDLEEAKLLVAQLQIHIEHLEQALRERRELELVQMKASKGGL